MTLVGAGRTITQVVLNQGAAGATDLVAAPGVGLKIYVVAIVLTMDAAGTLKFTEGTSPTDITGVMNFAANGGMVVVGDGANVILQTQTPNSKLSITTVTGKAQGYIRYFVDPN